MDYFISDIHLGHKNVLSFDNRPFKTNEEQNEYIIVHWNERIKDDDDVWILGDVSWVGTTETITFYKHLRGRLHLIIGNHDSNYIRKQEFRDLFASIDNYKEIDLDERRKIVLSHYPLLSYKNSRIGWIHLYGHVHNTREWTMMEQIKSKMKSLYLIKDHIPTDECFITYNVGCMCPYIQYIPRTLQEIIDGYDDCVLYDRLGLKPLVF